MNADKFFVILSFLRFFPPLHTVLKRERTQSNTQHSTARMKILKGLLFSVENSPKHSNNNLPISAENYVSGKLDKCEKIHHIDDENLRNILNNEKKILFFSYLKIDDVLYPNLAFMARIRWPRTLQTKSSP